MRFARASGHWPLATSGYLALAVKAVLVFANCIESVSESHWSQETQLHWYLLPEAMRLSHGGLSRLRVMLIRQWHRSGCMPQHH